MIWKLRKGDSKAQQGIGEENGRRTLQKGFMRKILFEMDFLRWIGF